MRSSPDPGAARASGFVRSYRRHFAAAAVFSLVINLALLMPSLYMLQVFDRVLPTRSLETLAMLSLVTALGLALMFALDLARGRLLALLGGLFERTVGRQVLAKSLEAGASQAFALRDVAALRGFLGGAGIVALFDAPWMLVYVGVIFLFSPVLGCLALASAAVLVVLAVLGERATRSGLEQVQQRSREAQQFVDAMLRGAEVVRALGMAGAVAARWERASGDIQARQLGMQRIAGALGSATKCFRQSVQVVMLAAAAWLVIEQRATPGVMIAVTIILGRALSPVEALIGQWKPLVEARAAARRLRTLMSASTPPVFAGLPEPRGAMALEGVTYAPPGAAQPVLRNLHLEIAAGEVVAIVGPSGSGKSTLARLLLGVIAPSAGRVKLDGAELAQWVPERLGAHLGYLPQNVALFSGSVAENIARLADGSDAAIVDAAQRAQAHELIVGLARGYATPVGDAGSALSGGQRQRVALARALYGAPKLVVLDEPNANLDAEGEAALKRAIEGLKAAGTTVVLVTQRTQILPVADRILVMRDGVLERIGVRQAGTPGEPGGLHGVPVLQPAAG